MRDTTKRKIKKGDVTKSLQGDSDVARVFAILRGAHRAEYDPDIDLATVIDGLQGARDGTIQSALIDLVSDADPD